MITDYKQVHSVSAVEAAYKREIVARSVTEAEDKLNAAVHELQPLAKHNGLRGILVTRTGTGRYTVELSTSVPYGLTQETTTVPTRTGSDNARQRKGNHQVDCPKPIRKPTLVTEETA